MNNRTLCTPCRSLTTIIAFVLAFVPLPIASFDGILFGQEDVIDFEEPFENTTSKVPWWHAVWYHSDGSLRYKNRITTSICNRQYLLPAEPNVYGPDFGYHQTSWNQLPYANREASGERVLIGKSAVSNSKNDSPSLSRRDRVLETMVKVPGIPKTQIEEMPYLPPESRMAKKLPETVTIRQTLEVNEQRISSPQGQRSDKFPELQTVPKAPQVGLRPRAVKKIQTSEKIPELLTSPSPVMPAQSRQEID